MFVTTPIDSKRSLVYHAGVTVSATLLGFVFGSLLGIVLAVGIVHLPVLDRSLLPWIIASQTVPILAIAPMVVVVLGNLGLDGLLPKAIISMYLCFFPVTVGMVKGLRSPDPLQLDLMRTYSATPAQVFRKLRWPSATGFLFASLKVAIAASLVGAIVGELPTGAQAGLGARLLSGSYYGQTMQIWSALIMASLVGVVLVFLVGCAERWCMRVKGVASMKLRLADLPDRDRPDGRRPVGARRSDGWTAQPGALAFALIASSGAALLPARRAPAGRSCGRTVGPIARRGRTADPARRTGPVRHRQRRDCGCSSPDGRCFSGSGSTCSRVRPTAAVAACSRPDCSGWRCCICGR